MNADNLDLVENILLAVKYQKNCDAERNGPYTASGFEAYALIQKALEDKDIVSKELKDCMKELWIAVKGRDAYTQQTYLQEISRIARNSAEAWVIVAALAEKANESATRHA